MIVDKKRVKKYVDELKGEMLDLCHCDELYTEMWVERAKGLRLVGAWWDYAVLISLAKRYIRQNCPQFLKRFESILKTVKLQVFYVVILSYINDQNISKLFYTFINEKFLNLL